MGKTRSRVSSAAKARHACTSSRASPGYATRIASTVSPFARN